MGTATYSCITLLHWHMAVLAFPMALSLLVSELVRLLRRTGLLLVLQLLSNLEREISLTTKHLLGTQH